MPSTAGPSSPPVTPRKGPSAPHREEGDPVGGTEEDFARRFETWGNAQRLVLGVAALILALVVLPGNTRVIGMCVFYLAWSAAILWATRLELERWLRTPLEVFAIVFDTGVIALATYAFGSQTSPLAFLFVPTVVGWSLQRNRWMGRLALGSSLGLYGLVLLLEGVGVLPIAPLVNVQVAPFAVLGGPAVTFSLFFVALLAAHLFLVVSVRRIERHLSFAGKLMAERAVRERWTQVQHQVERAKAMEELGRLSGGVASELGDVLDAIRRQIREVRDEVGPTHALWDRLDEIDADCRKAWRITSRLADFGHRQVVQLDLLDLAEVVEELAPVMCRVLGDDIDLEVERTEDLPLVKEEPAKVEDVLVRLALHARRAMPAGGRFTVATYTTVVEPGSTTLSLYPGTYVVLATRDSSVGLDSDEMSTILTPGRTPRTGLDLAMVYGVLQERGGTLEIDNEPGVGTTFRTYWPKAPG